MHQKKIINYQPLTHSLNYSSPHKIRPPIQLTSPKSRALNQSRQLAQSSHKIAQKQSPFALNLNKNQSTQNDHSFQINSSGISVVSKKSKSKSNHKPNASMTLPLGDRSNHSPSKVVRVNFMSDSPQGSRTFATHIRQMRPSPTKVHMVQMPNGREGQLLRKLSILQSRVGELHREKHEAMARLNEQNRRIYHQNTTLKFKISEMVKINESKTENSRRDQKIGQLECDLSNIPHHAEENDLLRSQIGNLQNNLNEQEQEYRKLRKQCGQIAKELEQKVKICEQQSTNLKEKDKQIVIIIQRQNSLKQALKQRQEQIIRLSESHQIYEDKIMELQNEKNKLLQQKITQENQIKQINQAMKQNQLRLQVITIQYNAKLKEYQNTIQMSKQIIEDKNVQIQPVTVTLSQQWKEESLQNQCKELENNFISAIAERDILIASHEKTILEQKQKISKLQKQNKQKQTKIDDFANQQETILQNDKMKTSRLVQASQLLQKVTLRLAQMQQKYTQLSERYEVQKFSRSQQGLTDKCRKCDQLTKTIFRMNCLLNPKKT